MRAVVWHGARDVQVDEVPDPSIREDTDAIVRITSSGLCGSDLHLYEVLGPFMTEGDILGHEPIGVVEEVGGGVPNVRPGDRVVVPFNISCGHCYMCDQQLYSQCETTRAPGRDKGASLFGYTKLYGSVPGAQAEYLRVPQAQFGPIKVPDGPPDDRFVYLSDVLPTAWQAVEYAATPPGGSLTVLGLGPIGQMCCRLAIHRGVSIVIGIDRVPERLALAQQHGVHIINFAEHDDVAAAVRHLTAGRGTDSVIDAVGMEAHGSAVGRIAHRASAFLPSAASEKVMETAGFDRLAALKAAIACVRRGGTVSVSGVYGGMLDPLPMMELFDKQIQLRMGQANVRRWTDEIIPLLSGPEDPLGVDTLATHHWELDRAPEAYRMFQQKKHGVIKVLFQP